MTELEVEMEVTIANEQILGDSATTDTQNVDELPWRKCVQGCRIEDEEQEIYSLSCFHSICSDECLEKFRDQDNNTGVQVLSCSICKFPVKPSDLATKVAPKKIFVKKPDYNDHSAVVVLVCQKCTLEAQAVAFCMDCSELLCPTCKWYHSINLEYKTHTVNDNIEHRKQDAFIDLLKAAENCLVHKEKLLEFYCCNCSSKLCANCLEGHTDHATRKLSDDFFMLESTVDASRKLQVTCEKAKLDLTKKESEIAVEVNTAMQQMADQTELLISALRRNQMQFNINANEMLKGKQAELKAKYEDVSIAEMQSLTLSVVALEIINNRDEAAAANVMMKYETFISQFTAADKLIRRNYDEFVENGKGFRFQQDGNKSLFDFEKLGRLEYISCAPQIQPVVQAVTIAVASQASGDAATINDMSQPSTSVQTKRLRIESQSAPMNSTGPTTSLEVASKPIQRKKRSSSGRISSNGMSSEHSGVSTGSVSSGYPTPSSSPSSGSISTLIFSGPTFCGSNARQISSDSGSLGSTFSPPNSSGSNSSGLPSTKALKSNRGKRPQRLAIPTFDLAALEEAPLTSIEEIRLHSDYFGEQTTPAAIAIGNARLCAICRRELLDDPLKECKSEGCGRFFHVRCHAPILKDDPKKDPGWECYFCTTKEQIISAHPLEVGSEDKQLILTNNQFYLACKFMMECYNLQGISTMRWYFPDGYKAYVCKGKVPFHPQYIRWKLTTPIQRGERPFGSVLEFISSFRQMFIQGFAYYQRFPKLREQLKRAHECFEQFIILVEHYYPQYRWIFDDVFTITNNLAVKLK